MNLFFLPEYSNFLRAFFTGSLPFGLLTGSSEASIAVEMVCDPRSSQ